MFDPAVSLGGLFVWSFLAATLVPLSSEVALAAAHAAALAPPAMLLAVATLGNTLGAAVNWGLGRYFLHFQHRRWFPFKPRQVERAAGLFGRLGWPVLLLSWLPVVGDPLTFAAGMLRYPFGWFLALVVAGKAARYAVVLGLTDALLP